MPSYLEKQKAAFQSNAAAASSKVNAKRTSLAPPTDAPSPAGSNTSNTSKTDKDNKRKREVAPQNVVYSQPAVTGYGSEIFTQVTYVIEFLKKKDEAKTLQDILLYLSRTNIDEKEKRFLVNILKRHERVEWVPDPESKTQAWNSGTFRHRPIINVRSKKELIAYLQNKPDAQGVKFVELKDGWPDCQDAIDELEAENKLLVTRTKKDNHPRMVWANDPSLVHSVDPTFQVMWHKVELPTVDELVRKLMDAGQKPASEDPSKRVKAAPKPKEKKRKAPRKGGKITNNHMAHLLIDYDKQRR